MSASARWATLESILHEALARDPSDRARYLDGACPDAATRREVEALLDAHERPGRLDALADAVMSPLLPPRDERPRRGGLPGAPAAVGRYRIVDRLGGGGMGVVYRARDERLDRDVALKVLPPHLSADEAAKKRFMVEARAAASLEHPNICTVHEIGESDDGQLYIVMGCYEGETLDRRIARGPLPVDEALRVATEIARGLAKAHERGIVHRDVKPGNVMLTRDGHVKVLDFGIAKLASGGGTQTVGAIGTVAYMSPEQAFGEAVDHRADVWALGVVTYEMLTGVRPFRGPSEHAVLVAALTAEPEPVTDVRRDVPPALDAVLRRALGKRPADRYDSVTELAAALAAGASPAGSGAGAVPAADPAGAGARESALARVGERRHATEVACAVAGYADLVEQLAPEETDQALARVRDAATEAAARHGGIVNHFSGDELVMLFGVPTAHEDHFVRGVRAALDLAARVAAVGESLRAPAGAALRLRAGIHAGTVVAQRLRSGDRRFRVTGAPMDVAVRLAALAEAGAVLVSPECRRLVAPFVETAPAAPVSLGAGAPPVVPHRVLGESGVASRLEHAERTGLTPYAGRSRELRALEERLAPALAGAGGVAFVIGDAGTGKSRLLHELRRRTLGAGVRVLVGRCDAYGETTPFLPFVQAVGDALGLPAGGTPGERHDRAVAAVRAVDPSLDAYLPLYLALLAIPSEPHPVPEHWQGKRFQSAMLEALTALFTLSATRQPALVLLEDWHWADEASQAALRQLAEVVAAFPLLAIVTARPEGAAGWESSEHQTRLHLGPLDLAASEAIVRAVLGAERVAPELAAQLHERTGGNPFFLEEVCQALRDDGAVAVRGGEAVVAAPAGIVHVPETVQGVIGTRIDRLDPDARDVLRVASVVGREFARGVLQDVTDPALDLAAALDRLKASGLIQQTGVGPEPAYRFKHALTQEVAYDSLLEHQRKSLHAAVGRAVERRHAARLDEHVERLAQHFARAEAWPEAVRYGIQAAGRAAALSRYDDALGTLEQVERWVAHLPDDGARRDILADVLLRQERLYESLGDRARQLRIVEALIALLAPHGASARLARAYLREGDVYTLLQRYDAAERALGRAAELSTALGDRAGEGSALRSIVLLRSYQRRLAEALESAERVLAIGRECGDVAAYAGDLATVGNLLRMMGEPERALRMLETGLDHVAASGQLGRGAFLYVYGALHNELGDPDRALETLQRALDEGIERREPSTASHMLPYIGQIHLEQGRIEEALAAYQRGVDESRRVHYVEGLARSLLSLGHVLSGLGRHGEALPHLREAARLFTQLGDEEVVRQTWRGIAEAHERLGEPAEARQAWETMLEQARRLDDRRGETDALEGIGRAARQSRDPAGAVPAYEAALAIASRLGDRERELSLCNALGIAHWEGGRHAEALEHYEAALALCRETGDPVHEGLMLNSVGAVLHRLGRRDEAVAALEQGARVNAATGQRRLESHALATLGDVHAAAGRLADARRAIEASLAIRRATDDRRGEGWMLERLARILHAEGDAAGASEAAAAARAIVAELDDGPLCAALERIEETHDRTTDHSPTG